MRSGWYFSFHFNFFMFMKKQKRPLSEGLFLALVVSLGSSSFIFGTLFFCSKNEFDERGTYR